MQPVTICTKLGLNDLASDTPHPCAEWGQKTVSKSLFICLSYEFPLLTVHRAPHHLQCLWESGGDSSHCWCLSPASLLEQGHSLHCMVGKGGHHLPWGLEQYSIQFAARNFQLSGAPGDLWHFLGKAAHGSTHSLMHGFAATVQTCTGTFTQWNKGVRAVVLPVRLEGT